MATANFHARLERIQKSQNRNAAPLRNVPVRELGSHMPGATPAGMIRRRRHPVIEHLRALCGGALLGSLAAVTNVGLTWEGSPWGPGTELNGIIWWPAMGSLGLAAVLMLASLILASRRPGFALFSLGYLSALMLALVA